MADANDEAVNHAREQKIFAVFNSFDKEKFGYISVNDLKDALEKLNIELT